MLTVRGWVELPPPSLALAPPSACWVEPRRGLGVGVMVVGLVGESMWKTKPVLGSAFSDQVSSSMLHMGIEHRNITTLSTSKLRHVILIISISCKNNPRLVYYDIIIITSDSQSRRKCYTDIP